MIKIKILKITPIWLTCLIIVLAIQTAVGVTERQQFELIKTSQAALEPAVPKVLGDSTSIRGVESLGNTAGLISKIHEPDLSGITAKSFLVFDLNSGQNLLQKNSDQKLFIASLTKLLTGFLAYQNIDLSQQITITKKDILNVSPNLNFAIGDSVKANDIFNAMLIGSCNDAALALANYVSQAVNKPFADLMNQEAKDLGMASSHFSNPMGFDNSENYSTANDLKVLISATQQLAVFKNLGRRSSYDFSGSLEKGYHTVATNKLIEGYPDIQAIKTGYTQGAGGAMATKITTNGHEIILIVLDSKNREDDTLKLRSVLMNDFNWN